jgi:regulator of sigma E protease
MLDALAGLAGMVGVIVPFIVALAIIVAVHEYGHYIVGRWCGIGAEAFSIGFGKELYGWTDKRGTRWKISLLPLGGYVKFLGDADAASTVKDEEAWRRLNADQRAHSFHDASVGRRALTVLAGPFANFILAAVVFGVMALAAGAPSDEPVIGTVAEDANPAFAEALRAGDRVTAVNGAAVPDFETLSRSLLDSRGAPLDITLERNGETLTVSTVYAPPARVDGVVPGGPADEAGLAPGDRIVAIDGAPVDTFAGLQERVSAAGGEALSLTVARDGETFEATLTPRMTKAPDPETGAPTERPLIGIQKSSTEVLPVIESVGPVAAMGVGVERTWRVLVLSVAGIWDVIRGAQAADEVLGGPIRIAELSGEAAAAGLSSFVGLVAILSASIGLINLFPVPILDGGHLVFYAIEAVRGRPLREKWQEIGNRIGFGLVLALMLFATVNDIARL